MIRIGKILRSQKGESLAETLTAIIIISLASVALASMIGTASRMNMTAKENDERLYAAITELETKTGDTGSATVTVTLDDNAARKVSYTVSTAQGGDGLLKAFYYPGGAP